MNSEMHPTREEILFKDECYQIQGAVFEVYREMGCGYLEAVYQECLEREFFYRKIPFKSKKEQIICYKREVLEQTYIPDFICYAYAVDFPVRAVVLKD